MSESISLLQDSVLSMRHPGLLAAAPGRVFCCVLILAVAVMHTGPAASDRMTLALGTGVGWGREKPSFPLGFRFIPNAGFF